MEETGANLSTLWDYNPDLFDEATITRMMSQYGVLLAGMVATPDALVFRLPILNEAERASPCICL